MHLMGQAWKAPVSCSHVAGVGKVPKDRPVAPFLPADTTFFRAKSKCLCLRTLPGFLCTLNPTSPFAGTSAETTDFVPSVGRDLQVRSSKGRAGVHACATPGPGTQRSRLWLPGSTLHLWVGWGLPGASPAAVRVRGVQGLLQDRDALSCLTILPLPNSLLRIKVECLSGPSAVSEKQAPSSDHPLQPWLFSLLHFEVQT